MISLLVDGAKTSPSWVSDVFMQGLICMEKQNMLIPAVASLIQE